MQFILQTQNFSFFKIYTNIINTNQSNDRHKEKNISTHLYFVNNIVDNAEQMLPIQLQKAKL